MNEPVSASAPAPADLLSEAVRDLLSAASRTTYRRMLSTPSGTWWDVKQIADVDPAGWARIAAALDELVRTDRYREKHGLTELQLWLSWLPAPAGNRLVVLHFYEPRNAVHINAATNPEWVWGADEA